MGSESSTDEATGILNDIAESDDPFATCRSWLGDAEQHEINDANAMALATVDSAGLPNVRTVLLKGIDEAGEPARGFVFYTNFDSAKGRELIGNPKAALLFHWKSLGRQVRIRGIVSRVTGPEADAYFATRPRLSRIGAWASDQSRPLESRDTLEKKVGDYTAKFHDGEIPRPEHWSGFRLTPLEIEFWHNREYRLHDRIVYRRDAVNGPWRMQRLYP